MSDGNGTVTATDVMTKQSPALTETPKPLTLEERMIEVRKRAGYVQKTKDMEVGGGRKVKYASAEAVLNKVRDIADEMGLVTSSQAALTHWEVTDGVTRCSVHLRIAFGYGGRAVVFEGVGGGQDKGDKAVMKANTAAIKYAMASGLLLSWGDDPEADPSTSTDEPGEKPAKKGRKPADPAVAAEKEALAQVRELLAASKTIEDLPAIKELIQTKLAQGKDNYKTAVGEYTARKTALMENK